MRHACEDGDGDGVGDVARNDGCRAGEGGVTVMGVSPANALPIYVVPVDPSAHYEAERVQEALCSSDA